MSTNLVLLPTETRATHLHVIGQSGTGKSRALESWILQDIAAGRGVGVIDPHGELYHHLLTRIAQLCLRQPSLADRVVLINPVDKHWTVTFNPLEAIAGYSSERLASFLSDVVIKIWEVDVANAPRMVRLLMHTFLALTELGLSLVDLPSFLINETWREQLLRQVRHPDVVRYFHYEFPKTSAGTHQWVTPVLNKLGALLFDPDLRLMFSGKSTIHFRKIIDEGLVLLVNTSKGLLGESNSALLEAFLVAHLQKAALSRASGAPRRPYYLYLDEFQNYTTENLRDILSESRKYALSLILVHQYLDQLSPELLSAVLNSTGTLVSFRTGYEDAARLAKSLFPPDYLTRREWQAHMVRIGKMPMPVPLPRDVPLTPAELIAILTELPNREFVVRRRGPYPPLKQRTLPMPAPPRSDELWRHEEALIRRSGERYGRLKTEIRVEPYDGSTDVTDAEVSYYEEIPPPALSPGQ